MLPINYTEPNAKKIINIGSQLAKKSGNMDTKKKKKSVELITSFFFEVVKQVFTFLLFKCERFFHWNLIDENDYKERG